MTNPGGLSTRTNEYPGGGDYFRLINVARDSACGGIEKFVMPAVQRAKILIHSALEDENGDCADC